MPKKTLPLKKKKVQSKKNPDDKKKQPGFKKTPGTESAIAEPMPNIIMRAGGQEIPRICQQPFVITLENLTDEKIYNVNLFNLEFENQNKIQYSNGLKNLTYKELLYLKSDSSNACMIGRIQTTVNGDYKKFWVRQLNSQYSLKVTSLNGNGVIIGANPKKSPYQMQENTVVTDVCWRFNSEFNIQLEFLMPEVSITFYLYPLA